MVDQGGRAGADPHLSEPAVAVPPHGCQQAIGLLVDALRMLDQLAAGSGRERALAQAIDQLHAKTRLELAYLETDGRLREIEPLGRPREAALRDHFGQRAQMIRVHATHCDLQS